MTLFPMSDSQPRRKGARRARAWRKAFLLLGLATGCGVFGSPPRASGAADAEGVTNAVRAPTLSPDYARIIIPPNIAPLNFKVEEPGTSYRVEFRSTKGQPLTVTSRNGAICIPMRPWHELVGANAGEQLCCDVSVRDRQGRWSRFTTVTNLIAQEQIDRCLVYRLLRPLYSIYVNIGIYQRDLKSFSERPVLENQHTGGGCLNCHTFLNHRPDTFALDTRGETNSHPTLLVVSNEVARVDKTLGYLSWHPSGRLLAFSANKFSLFYHTCSETRDVFDARSNLGIYRIDSNVVVVPPALALPHRNETWPCWSPDGKYLYYCSGPRLAVDHFRQVRYDLMRIGYDIAQDRWGEPEVLLSAQDSGGSAAQPKVSPDNRYVLFCLAKYGNFPAYQPSSDLFVLELQSRRCRGLSLNSDQADSWHCWSSNGRWIVFSSKRLDGLFTRPFFSYVARDGEFSKPFVLPQADAAFYESCLQTFNLPELVVGPIQVKESALARALLHPLKVLRPEGQTRPPAPDQPAVVSETEGQKRYGPTTK